MQLFCFASRVLFGRKPFLLVSKNIEALRMSSVDLRDVRVKYKERDEAFTEDQLVSDEPINQFTAWFDEVKKCPDIIEPNAMCVATASKDGFPSARMVLLKGYGPEGFKFFTNYESRKGIELAENPQASLLFYWPPFNRQVRIEGTVTKTPEEESRVYFDRRPLGSRVSAAISPQSKPVPNRQFLVDAANELSAKGDVQRPEFWGGYLLRHDKVEFWQGQSDRLHDRLVYTRDGDKWSLQRLAP